MPMATGFSPRACSIVTLDGYVSQGKASYRSKLQDHAMLQDFATYLELRLKCINMSMLRRIFADFLNGHENTLVPMMHAGCTIITVFPVLRTSAERRHRARALLAAPKHPLAPRRGCVFLYLQSRTATRNMALLKQLFVDFIYRRDVELLAFVARGSHVMSVIPFELPRMTPLATQEEEAVASQTLTTKSTTSSKRKRAIQGPKGSTDSVLTNVGSPVLTLNEMVALPTQELGAAHNVLSVRKRKRASAVAAEPSGGPVVLDPAAKVPSKRVKNQAKASLFVVHPKGARVATSEDAYAEATAPPFGTKSPFERATTSEAHVLAAVAAAATKAVHAEGIKAVAKSPLKSGRKAKASKEARQDAAFVAAMERFDVDDTKVVPLEQCRTRRRKASKMLRQEATLEAVTKRFGGVEMTESVAESVAGPAANMPLERGRKLLANTVPRQEAASVTAIELVESAGAQWPTMTTDVATSAMEMVESDAVNAAASRGRSPCEAKNVRQDETTRAIATELIEFNVVDSGFQLQSNHERNETELIQATEVARNVTESGITSPLAHDEKLKSCSEPHLASTVAAIEVGVAKPSATLPAKRERTSETSNSLVMATPLVQIDVPHADTVDQYNPSVAAMAPVHSAFALESNFYHTDTLHASRGSPQAADLTHVAALVAFLVTKVANSAENLSLHESETVPNLIKAVVTSPCPYAAQVTLTNRPTTSKDCKAAIKRVKSIATNVDAQRRVDALPRQSLALVEREQVVASIQSGFSKPAAESMIIQVDTPETGAAQDVTTVVQSVLAAMVLQLATTSVELQRGHKRKSESIRVEKATSLTQSRAARDKWCITDSDFKVTKRGKPVMSPEVCHSQLALIGKMETVAAQAPWKTVFHDLSIPFDATKHPALARQLHAFWVKHSHAVWERMFWAPVSRRLTLVDFNKRNNRQLAAKNAFELLIVSAFEKLGPAFFVMLDSQEPRHPGWWYRGPVVALFAFQLNRGKAAMWDYVQEEAWKRFPDCKQPLPLAASNSGAMRMRHQRESASMWMTNHQETAKFLHAIGTLKADNRAGPSYAMDQIAT